MAYDRYDNRGERNHSRDDDRGFFERAGDEIASWFGDDDSERRRHDHERMQRNDPNRSRYNYGGWGEGSRSSRDSERGYGRHYNRDRSEYRGSGREPGRSRDEQRSYQPMDWTSSDRDYRSSPQRSTSDFDRPSYGRSSNSSSDYERSESPWGRDDYRNTSYAGSTRDNDRHYHSWKQRQLDELDRDYSQYCRERQDKFENDFGTWRQSRMNQRRQLGSIREHMDVVGNDGESVGKVDKVKGDRIVLTKSDSADHRHHAIDCSMVDSIEGDQVKLNCNADDIKKRWESADDRGFFGRDRDNEETNLNRSFSGTYES